MCRKKALIAMSGGVDSSVAAFLSLQEGFDCVGGTMELLCNPSGDAEDARAVAQRLNMDFHVFSMQQEFRQQVMDKFVRCYEEGLTPNPCVDCNRTLKFGALLEQALALGHGCSRLMFDYESKRVGNDLGVLLQISAPDTADADSILEVSYNGITTTKEDDHIRMFPTIGTDENGSEIYGWAVCVCFKDKTEVTFTVRDGAGNILQKEIYLVSRIQDAGGWHYEIEKLKVEDNRYCENCFHWVRIGMGQSGKCQRYPPQVVGVPQDRFGDIKVKSYFPEVFQSEWCGEWKNKSEV